MASASAKANFVQDITPALRAIANREAKQNAYKSILTFVKARASVAERMAIAYTIEQYPLAMSRDAKRRPAYARGGVHLQNAWKLDRSGITGDHPSFKLVNTRPKAAMLIMGIGSPSEIKPKNFFYKYANGKRVPVLVYPSNDGRKFVPFNQALKNPHAVVRPVPSSQRPVKNSDSIPYKAIKYAFVNAPRQG